MRTDFCTHRKLHKNMKLNATNVVNHNINIQLNTLCHLQTDFKDNIEEHEKSSLNDFLRQKQLLGSLKMCAMRQGNEVFLHTAFEDPLDCSDRSLQSKTREEINLQLKRLCPTAD